MTDTEVFALEKELMKEIEHKKFSWRKVLAILELSAIAENH